MGKTASAFLAIVGRPNVGKSSLLNRFVGEKVAIVSPKPQTTRTRITGVLTQEDTQFVFIDTPGLHNPKTKLSEFMVKQIKDSVADVDAAVLVTEPLGKIQQSWNCCSVFETYGFLPFWLLIKLILFPKKI